MYAGRLVIKKVNPQPSQHKANRTTCRYNELRLSMFQKNGPNLFPVLKGKAAELRHFAPALLYAATAFLSDTRRHEKLMKTMLQLAVRMEVVLDQNAGSYALPDRAQKEFEHCASTFVQINSALGHHFHPQGLRLFNHTIKFHYMSHLSLISRRVNPRIGWCYSGEDLMQRVKLVVAASQRGAGPSVVVPKAMLKYAQGLGMMLGGRV